MHVCLFSLLLLLSSSFPLFYFSHMSNCFFSPSLQHVLKDLRQKYRAIDRRNQCGGNIGYIKTAFPLLLIYYFLVSFTLLSKFEPYIASLSSFPLCKSTRCLSSNTKTTELMNNCSIVKCMHL